MSEFKECAPCAAKPGTPQLCSSCLHNREVIRRQARVTEALYECRKAYDAKEREWTRRVGIWREGYRAALASLHDENNTLRSLSSTLNAKLAAKNAPRSLLEKFFNLPKD